jgi:outer membrane protein OmpA-like peptidoglycan-associated protein
MKMRYVLILINQVLLIKANLEKLVPVFTEYPDTDITIFGYTDITGPADYNLKLSKERAASVRNYLVAKGIA